MVHKLSGEESFGRELFDLLCIFRMVGNLARPGLGKSGNSEETKTGSQAQQNMTHNSGPLEAGVVTGGIIQPSRRFFADQICFAVPISTIRVYPW
jgi:hypothetical protein